MFGQKENAREALLKIENSAIDCQNDTEQSQEPDLRIKTIIRTIASLSVYPMIGQIIHPAPHFIATALLGYEENSLEDLAALSSATSAIVIVVTSI